MENVLSEQWLIIVLIVVGIAIGAFLAKKDALKQGHFIVLALYLIFIFILIMNYSKLKETRPNQYKKNIQKNLLPKSVNIIGCKNLDCLEPIENTYEYHLSILDDTNCRSKYIDWTRHREYESQIEECYIHVRDTVEVNSGKRQRIYNLRLRDFFIKSAFNCCASGNLKNDYVNIESMNLAIKLGCRFLDFEIYTINGEPAVAVSSNRDSFHYKESFNHIPFDQAMRNARERAMTPRGCKNYTDPLILHFRVKTSIATTYKKIANILRNTFGSTIFTFSETSQSVRDMSPFSLPIQATIGRVFIVFNNYAGSETVVGRSKQYMSEYMMKNTDMKYVLTTWSGDRNNNTDENEMLREHLHVVYGIDRERLHHLSVAKLTSAGRLQDNYGLGIMAMLWPFKDNGAILEPSYKTINVELAERENTLNEDSLKLDYFKLGDLSKSEHDKIAKGKLIQIVPICVQQYQNLELDEGNNLNNGFFHQWWRFFHSAKYSKYMKDIEVCPIGLRQRIPKYDDLVVTSSIELPNNHYRSVRPLD